MKQIIRFRWLVALIWVAGAVLLLLFSPNLQQLVAEKGQINVPDDAPSRQASKLIEKMDQKKDKHASTAVLVYQDTKPFSKEKKAEIKQAISELEKHKKKLAVTDVLSFDDDPAIAEQTISKDKKTIIVPFQVSVTDDNIDQRRKDIETVLKPVKLRHYLTGETFINYDINKNSEEGLKKTELITVGLILIILFIVFRSLVAPLIPLITVGISYVAAQGIVSILAKHADFPLSTFTQIFMVAVMFGIGTDYCILLISRFKEEMHQQESIHDAVLATYKSGGKTVFFAGIAVLIGFSSIGLSTFTLYRSAVAVAVGVAVVLLALTTLVPFFLAVLGRKLFWPFDKNAAHSESRMWGAMGRFSWQKPLISLLIIVIITVPFLVTYDGEKSFNSLEEIGEQYDSVKGFNLISKGFGPGQTMPATLVMTASSPVNSVQDYQDIETITREIARLDGVEEVRSATRPSGSIIKDFLMTSQTDQLANGIGKSTDGLEQIQKGLQDGSVQLKDSGPQLDQAKTGAESLMQGIQSADNGVGQIKSALNQIQTGIETGAVGAGEAKRNLQTVKTNLDQTISSSRQLLQGYQKLENGLKGFGGGQQMDASQLDALIGAAEGAKANAQAAHKAATEADPELLKNEKYMTAHQTAIGQLDGTAQGIRDMKSKLAQLGNVQSSLNQDVIKPLSQLNGGLNQVVSGQEQLSGGLGKLIDGLGQLESGLGEASAGQKKVADSTGGLQAGLQEIYGGQKAFKEIFGEMQTQLGQLSGGLNDSAEGVKQVNDGLTKAKDHLDQYEIDKANPIVVIPKEALDNKDFQQGIEPYLSTDKKIVKFDVILKANPYSIDAMNMIDQITDQANLAKKKTVFAKADPKIAGISSMNHDLEKISDADYSRTVFLMIAGIFIVLVFMLRSLIIPIYLIGSLVLTYFTSLGIAELLFVQVLGYAGLSWPIPFFAFVMLMALGIDYSIFLMDRFNEYGDLPVKEALLSSMRNMGTVIISAAVILGGTFAAMLPSGVLSLLQIATVVLIGLFMYAFVVIPLFVPVMVRLFARISWWPFKRKTSEHE